jgi:ABC-type multidrug transport system fused ATPase/permease subunit
MLRTIPWHVAAVSSLSLINVAAYVVTVTALKWYLDLRTNPGPHHHLIDLSGCSDSEQAAIFSTAIFLSMLVAGLSGYQSARLNLQASQRFYRRLVADVIESGTHWYRRAAGIPSRMLEAPLSLLISREAVSVSRLVIFSLRSIYPFFLLVATLIAMLWLNLLITACLIVLLGLYALPYVLINRSVIRSAERRDKSRHHLAEAAKSVCSRLPLLAGRPQECARIAQEFAASPVAAETLSTLRGILITQERVLALNTVYLGVVFVVFVLFVHRAGTDRLSLSGLVTFLLVLRFAYVGLNGVTHWMSRFSRQLPRLHRLWSILQGSTDGLKAEFPIVLRTCDEPTKRLPGSKAELAVQAGDIVAVIGAQKATSLGIGHLFLTLTRGRHADHPVHLALEMDISRSDLRDALDGLPELGWRFFDSLSLSAQARAVAAEERNAPIPPFLRTALALLPGVLADGTALIAPLALWRRLNDQERQTLSGALRGHPLFLTGASAAGAIAVNHFALVRDGILTGLGDAHWIESITADLDNGDRDKRDEDEDMDDEDDDDGGM